MTCPICGRPAVVLVTFDTGGRYPYCRFHAYKRGHLVWKPQLIRQVQRLTPEEDW